jgi:hypothetical protein
MTSSPPDLCKTAPAGAYRPTVSAQAQGGDHAKPTGADLPAFRFPAEIVLRHGEELKKERRQP